MRVATWNVNSVRTRVDRIIDFLKRSNTDVLAMQEIKCRPDQFPYLPFEEAGYTVVADGLNQWNGVAVATRLPVLESHIHFPGQPAWGNPPVVEARAIRVRVDDSTPDGFEVWSLYIPNGRAIDDPHYQYKLEWMRQLRTAARDRLLLEPLRQGGPIPGGDDRSHGMTATPAATPDSHNSTARVVLVGDWNVAPRDEDVWDINYFQGRTHVTPPEREAFASFADDGWVEVTRDRVTNYTYWDYQQLRFPRNEGMRIDFIYASPTVAGEVVAASIDRDERKGKGASDHVPVIIDLEY